MRLSMGLDMDCGKMQWRAGGARLAVGRSKRKTKIYLCFGETSFFVFSAAVVLSWVYGDGALLIFCSGIAGL